MFDVLEFFKPKKDKLVEAVEKVYMKSVEDCIETIRKINEIELEYIKERAKENLNKLKIYIIELKKARKLLEEKKISEKEFWETKNKLYKELLAELRSGEYGRA